MFRAVFNFVPKTATSASFVSFGTAGVCYAHYTRKHSGAHFVQCEPKPLFGLENLFQFGLQDVFGKKSTDTLAPLVLCGPSGVGKGTLIKILMQEYPECFGFSVSTTTRKPRPGEVDGKDYHFASSEEMLKMIDEGRFVEHAKVHTNRYGTSTAALDAVKSANKIAILDIDIQGAQQVKAKMPTAHFVFLAPPSEEILEARLRGRGTEAEHKIQVRLKNAKDEIAFSKTPGFFDKVIVADENFKTALPTMRLLLSGWYPQLKEVKVK
jgi:guanylate kinase